MRSSRGHLAIINRSRFTVLEPDHHEAAAAEISGRRVSHGERKRNGDRSVNRVATALHDLDAHA